MTLALLPVSLRHVMPVYELSRLYSRSSCAMSAGRSHMSMSMYRLRILVCTFGSIMPYWAAKATFSILDIPEDSNWLAKDVLEQISATGGAASRPLAPEGLRALEVEIASTASAMITPSAWSSQASMSSGEMSACRMLCAMTSCTATPSGEVMWARGPDWLPEMPARTPRNSSLFTTVPPSTTSVSALSTSDVAQSPRTYPSAQPSSEKVRPVTESTFRALLYRNALKFVCKLYEVARANGIGSQLPTLERLVPAMATATKDDAPSRSMETQGPFMPWTKEKRPQAILPEPPQTPELCFSVSPHSSFGGRATYTPPLEPKSCFCL
mmetsp:Transcript_85034/g.259723  ORF Transcript_85034/g.259723 Transcript_85034/m.259723 type:complete len:325 (+) Transcript_85034:1343-2317(+)